MGAVLSIAILPDDVHLCGSSAVLTLQTCGTLDAFAPLRYDKTFGTFAARVALVTLQSNLRIHAPTSYTRQFPAGLQTLHSQHS